MPCPRNSFGSLRFPQSAESLRAQHSHDSTSSCLSSVLAVLATVLNSGCFHLAELLVNSHWFLVLWTRGCFLLSSVLLFSVFPPPRIIFMICTVHPSPTLELLTSSLHRSTRPSHVMCAPLSLNFSLFRIRLMTSSTLSLGDTISGNVFDPSTLTKICIICRFFLTSSDGLGSCVLGLLFTSIQVSSMSSGFSVVFSSTTLIHLNSLINFSQISRCVASVSLSRTSLSLKS